VLQTLFGKSCRYPLLDPLNREPRAESVPCGRVESIAEVRLLTIHFYIPGAFRAGLSSGLAEAREDQIALQSQRTSH
jgi:hypothetical protein